MGEKKNLKNVKTKYSFGTYIEANPGGRQETKLFLWMAQQLSAVAAER